MRPTHVIVATICQNCAGFGDVEIPYIRHMKSCTHCGGTGSRSQAISLKEFNKILREINIADSNESES